MSSLRIAALFGLAMLTLVAAVSAAYAQNTVGTITQSLGMSTIERSGATIPVATHMPVELHDKIMTGPGASLTIQMVDKSSLQLIGGSTLTIDESMLVNGTGAPSKVGLLGGGLHSIILGAMRGSSTTFQVNTPNAIGAVRGTDWWEHYSTARRSTYGNCQQFTDFDVFDGTVNVCNREAHQDCKDVTGGHHTTVACGRYRGLIVPIVLGVGVGAGAGVGIAAAAGAFSGPSPSPPPPISPAH